jgi:D-alanyl-D-alanine carboxypeptidase
MKPQEEARELASVGETPDGRPVRLTPEAALAWTAMRDAAAADGVTLVPVSGFRSIARQEEIFRAKLERGETIEAVLATIAAPGYSEHHTGRAIDIAVPGLLQLTEDFAGTPAFRWLEAHARTYGFTLSYPRGNAHGFRFEPWHWCHSESPRFSPVA